jgi:acyl-CoA thioesterase
MPEVKPPETCEQVWSDPGSSAPFRERFDTRPAIGAAPFEGARQALGGGWIRAAEPRVPDALLIATMTDAWPPSLMSRFASHEEWRGAPTIDLTVHFRSPLPESARKPDTFLLGVYRTREVRGGFMEEDGEIWTRDGTLLAQSRQLAVFA